MYLPTALARTYVQRWHERCGVEWGKAFIEECRMFEYWHGGWHMWWMGASWIIGLVMVALFVGTWVHGRAFQPSGLPEGPEAMLKRRSASGEINTDEYDQRLIELRK